MQLGNSLGQEMSFVHSSVPKIDAHRLRSIFEHEIEINSSTGSKSCSSSILPSFSRNNAEEGVVYATAGVAPEDLILKVEVNLLDSNVLVDAEVSHIYVLLMI